MQSHSSTKNESVIKSESGWQAILFNSVLFNSIRILMGVVFLYASYDKIMHPEAFAKAVYNYHILPDYAVNIVALWLPWIELLLGLCLATGIWLPGATIITTCLLTVFIGAIVFNLSRGLNIDCGCFSSTTTGGKVGIWTVLRDISFLAASMYLSLRVFLLSKSPNI